MTTKIKIVIIFALLNIAIFKWFIPSWCIIQIIIGIGENNFYSIFANNIIYIVLSLILEIINIPSLFLNIKEKQWMQEEIERIKNK
jgi:hypothetical protein